MLSLSKGVRKYMAAAVSTTALKYDSPRQIYRRYNVAIGVIIIHLGLAENQKSKHRG